MFRGSSFHTIDPKGRLIIPARFRDTIRAGGGDGVMLTRMDSCLFAYTLEEWVKIETKILRFLTAASFDNSNVAGIASRAKRTQKIVPFTCLSSVTDSVSEPSIQPSKITRPVNSNDIIIPKNNLYLSILFYFAFPQSIN